MLRKSLPPKSWNLGIAVDSSHLYWADESDPESQSPSGSVVKAALDGGTPVVLASQQSGPSSVAVDSTSVYWTVTQSEAVMKAALDGGAPVTIAASQAQPGALALDDASVYWTNYGNGTVMKAPLGGGSATTLASGQWGPRAIAVDATSVYWTNLGCWSSTGACDAGVGSILKLTPK